jgi:predicted PurR-regulated permease PerM
MGIPNPLIWGVAAMMSSFIPGVGTSIITIPAIIFLFLTAPLWHGVGLIIWALGGVGVIDNFLSPFIYNRGIKIHPFLVLLTVLGGIAFFGPIGIIMGPIMLAFFFALLDIYPTIIQNK